MKKFLVAMTACALVFACGSDDDEVEGSNQLNLDASIGSVCGVKEIRGTQEASFSKGGCGITNPVKVYAISNVKLSSPALINCETAQTLNHWVATSVKPEAKKIGKTVTDINMMGAYSCRTRNHKKGAKLSEHAKGNAIDIGGFTFTDGSKVTLLTDYNSSTYSAFLRSIRKGACGPFGTVLGPGTNKLHANHFHFDVARYSMGAYCR